MNREAIVRDVRERLAQVEDDLAMMERHNLTIDIGRTDPHTTARRLTHLRGLIDDLNRLVASYEADDA